MKKVFTILLVILVSFNFYAQLLPVLDNLGQYQLCTNCPGLNI